LKGKKKKEKPFISLKKEKEWDRKIQKDLYCTFLFFQIEKISQFSRLFFVLKKWNVFLHWQGIALADCLIFSKKANFYFFSKRRSESQS
jgi:hypothetical protein